MIISTSKNGGYGTGLSGFGQDLQPATTAARLRRGMVAVGDVSAVGAEWSTC